MHTLKFSGRRAAAWLLTAVLTVTPVMPALAAAHATTPEVPSDWSSSFPDVKETDWFYPYVEALTRQGLIRGYDNGNFGPRDEIRAGDSIILVVRTAGGGDPEPPQNAHYAQGYVDTAVARGWVEREEVPQALNGSATRLFIARLAARALGIAPAMRDTALEITQPSPFSDVDDGYVTALFQEGIMVGTSDSTGQRIFMPDMPISRGELSAMVWRMADWQQNQPLTPDSQDPQDPGGQDPSLPEDPGMPQAPQDDPEDPGTEEPPAGIPFGNKVIDIVPGVPASPYDPDSFAQKDGRMTCSMEGVKTSFGIDVSKHQGVIDWKQVAQDGVEFAFIRVGGRYYGLRSGATYKDERFHINLQEAMANGLETGVYFFSQAISEKEAVEEAQLVISELKSHPGFQGPVVFDWENISNDRARTDNMTAAQVTAAALAFCHTVEAAGYSPMIYFNRYIAYELYQLDKVVQYPFWIADYSSQPQFYYNYAIWQYSDRGTVKGIKGAVDMNICISLEQQTRR